MLARVVQISGDLKIVFLTKYFVVGKTRINLNEKDNWIKSNEFHISPFAMDPAIILPEKTKYSNIKDWVLNLDDVVASNPAILGLPPRAELMILSKRAVEMCTHLLSLQDIETGNAMEELSAVLDDRDGGDNVGGAVPLWMKQLRNTSEKWKENIPESMSKLNAKADSIKNPLFRFMRREFQLATKVLQRMNDGLTDLIGFVDGDIKATNDLRQLIAKLAKEQMPKQWSLYEIDRNLGVSHCIIDFVKRVNQFDKIATSDYVSNPQECLWLGGLFQPEGFIAATRQYVAQMNKWPLESLKLKLEIGESDPIKNSFVFDGLILYGAGWHKSSKCLILTEKTQTPLPPSRFLWVNGESKEEKENGQAIDNNGKAKDIVSVQIPVYLNSSFKELLFSIHCNVYSSLPPEIWVQRAVSLSVWSN